MGSGVLVMAVPAWLLPGWWRGWPGPGGVAGVVAQRPRHQPGPATPWHPQPMNQTLRHLPRPWGMAAEVAATYELPAPLDDDWLTPRLK
jgi:hypothetical protein